MKMLESVLIALNSLRSNKLRSALTILGIVVGIFSIISISTILTMLQNSIESGVSSLGQNTFQIQKFPAIHEGGPGSRDKYRNRKDITLDEYYRLQKLLTIAKSIGAEQWRFGVTAQIGNKKTNPDVQLTGITPEAQPNNKWVIENGRSINSSDVDHYKRICILGKDVSNTLFGPADPVGQYIKIDGNRYFITGVYEAQGEMFGQSKDNFIAMPITTYQNVYGDKNNSINITIMAVDKYNYDQTIETSIGYMRTIRKVEPGKDNDFDIFSNESILSTINDMTKNIKIGTYCVAAIALLAAGVGIMNIMLVSVTERTREIGVRKAIGAKKANILVQFMLEAIVLCMLGGMIGIVLGVGVGNLAGTFLLAQPTIPVVTVMVGIILCIIVGLIFGTYPAYKASNLDPIEALRYE
jgi:putative ABC transport system permease protein